MLKQTPVTFPKGGIFLCCLLTSEEQFVATLISQLSQSLEASTKSFSSDGRNSMEDGKCLYLLPLRFKCRRDCRG